MAIKITTSDLEMLLATPVFAGASGADLEQIAATLEKRSFKKGAPIFVAQGNCEFVWIVASGSVEIVAFDNATKESRRIATLKKGQQFAEVAALLGSRHSAGAFALENTDLLAIKVENFKSVLSHRLHFALNTATWLSRLANNSIQKNLSIEMLTDPSPWTPDEAATKFVPYEILNQFSVIPLEIKGQRLTIGCLEPLSEEMYERLRKQNPECDIKPIILNSDQFKSLRQSLNKFYAAPAAARPTFTAPVIARPVDANETLELLKYSFLFSQLPDRVCSQLRNFLTAVEYLPGDIISRPSKPIEHVLIVESGTIESYRHTTRVQFYQSVLKYSHSDVVFDLKLLSGEDSNTGLIATSAVRAYKLSAHNFRELLKSVDFTWPLCVFLAQQLRDLNRPPAGLEIVDSLDVAPPTHGMIMIPDDMQIEHGIAVLSQEQHEVHIGTARLLKPEAMKALREKLPGVRIREKIVSKQFLAQFRKFSRTNTVVVNPSSKTTARVENLRPSVELFKVGVDDSFKLLDRIIIEAARHRTSDIHLDVREKTIIVRYRIDGSLVCLWEEIPSKIGVEVLRRAKMLAKMDIAQSRIPQDGRFSVEGDGFEIGLRVSLVPTRHGERVVMRLVRKRGEIVPLRQLASDRRTTSFFNSITKYRQGMLLVTGPTGSGKSTTLYSLLAELSTLDINVVTIEDPIEMNLPGINQIEVNEAVGMVPAALLRYVLRQDPDVIMIGEIRDAESMRLALEASMTGHLVLSSIHASSALEILPRLKELSMGAANVASDLIGVVSQRLVRSLCNQCKKSRPVSSSEFELLASVLEDGATVTEVMDPVGCVSCDGSGYHGQVPLFEFWQRNREIRNALADSATTEGFIAAVQKSGFETIAQYGLRMVANGTTSFAEVESTVYGLGGDELFEAAPQNLKKTDQAA